MPLRPLTPANAMHINDALQFIIISSSRQLWNANSGYQSILLTPLYRKNYTPLLNLPNGTPTLIALYNTFAVRPRRCPDPKRERDSSSHSNLPRRRAPVYHLTTAALSPCASSTDRVDQIWRARRQWRTRIGLYWPRGLRPSC